ncbi:MAG: hypothetical protein VB954_08585 [Thalassolituus sp.]|jgi:hypothetical protein|uniref:Kinase n=2 Tax=root TaxID=1 RepID=M5DNT5_9GAMM|nr:hypothetical protein [Thalassolituus oleivorans]PCI49778.1 MAG: hypothetical protein COB43_03540 [Oceanospirillales bacterium]PHQ87307.1 MAG: hypothetical protein COB58_05350 [Thalassobium sp.]APR68079.1 hypothetical protein CN03_14745 [Thalassolituus oleivorans]MBQ0727613.1 hypothetical protein [Thalassolituus oleivorans]MBQ0779830.1 hypothetical protein [Thalassolituus oleivorans]|tara:strand:+ start:228 stop:590 length:363 start_codon:yes stop_codon:yes gene_type:complete
MTEQQNTPEAEEQDIAKWCILSFMGGIIVAALALEYYGFIQHPKDADTALISEFKLLSLSPEHEVKVSPKMSGKEAFCVDGYILLRPTNGNAVAGILVDEKNRGVQCQHSLTPTVGEPSE